MEALPAEVLRTPDDRFAGLPGWPWPPNYVEVGGGPLGSLRMHYVDAGPAGGPTVLLMHGHPTWSFLWRRTIADLAATGHRVVAPDLIGYGRSDKPAEPADYSFAGHVGWVAQLVEALDLTGVTLGVHDWGGPIGLAVLAASPHRFSAVVATNTILHTCDPALAGRLTWAHHATAGGQMVLQQALLDYLTLYPRQPDVDPSLFVGAVSGPLAPDAVRAYDAPFPDRRHKAGLRQMPLLIPLTPNDPGAALNRATGEALRGWDRPFVTAFSDGDPATGGWDEVLRDLAPGSAGRPHRVIGGAGHFVPETHGAPLAGVIAETIRLG